MEGMVECAEEILGMPVRLGFPVGVKGITQLVHGPQYATGVGLVRYGASQLAEAYGRSEQAEHSGGAPDRADRDAAMARTKSGFWGWLRAAF